MQERLAQVKNALPLTHVQSLLNKANRARKSRVRLNNKRKSHTDQNSQPKVDRKQVILGAKVLTAVIVIGLVGFVAFIVWKVSSGIELRPSPLANAAAAPLIVGDQASILLAGITKNDSYSFVDFLAVLTVNPRDGKQKILVIDPDFTTTLVNGKNVKYRNVLNNAMVKNLSPLDTLEKAVETMLGLHIDRYITADIASLPQSLANLGIKYVAPEGLIDTDAGEFREGQVLEGAQLVKYLAAEEPGHNLKLLRLSKFVKAEMEDRASIWNILRLISAPDTWTSVINTNISKTELLNWSLSMLNTPTVQYTYIPIGAGLFVGDLTGGSFTPITLEIDRIIQDNFARSTVIKEQAKIEVYNGTTTGGLANVTKRLIVNQGGKVIRTGNYSDTQDRSKLYVPHPENFQYSVNLIKEVLRGKVIVVNEDYPFNHTGDMVLVVGTDAGE